MMGELLGSMSEALSPPLAAAQLRSQKNEAPMLDYALLEHFCEHRVVPQQKHHSAIKRAVWDHTLGLAHLRGAATCSNMFQALQSTTTKIKIWKYWGIDRCAAVLQTHWAREHPQLFWSWFKSETAVPQYLDVSMLAGFANPLGSRVVRPRCGDAFGPVDCDFGPFMRCSVANATPLSAIITLDKRSARALRLDVASYSNNESEMRVEALHEDGTLQELLPWRHYGRRAVFAGYTPERIPIDTTATKFKLSVRHRLEAEVAVEKKATTGSLFGGRCGGNEDREPAVRFLVVSVDVVDPTMSSGDGAAGGGDGGFDAMSLMTPPAARRARACTVTPRHCVPNAMAAPDRVTGCGIFRVVGIH